MPKTVDFYFTTISPYSYFAAAPFREMAARTGAEARYKPVNIMALFAFGGAKPLAERPEPARRYRMLELKRWRAYRGVPLNLEPKYFPTNPTLSCKVIVAAAAEGRDVAPLTEALLRACWAEEKDVGDPATVAAIAGDCGLDGAALLEAAESAAVESAFQANTDEAIGHGAWGVPSFVVDGELFWGQDRLEFVERKLTGA